MDIPEDVQKFIKDSLNKGTPVRTIIGIALEFFKITLSLEQGLDISHGNQRHSCMTTFVLLINIFGAPNRKQFILPLLSNMGSLK